jgi:hypothetical protein
MKWEFQDENYLSVHHFSFPELSFNHAIGGSQKNLPLLAGAGFSRLIFCGVGGKPLALANPAFGWIDKSR